MKNRVFPKNTTAEPSGVSAVQLPKTPSALADSLANPVETGGHLLAKWPVATVGIGVLAGLLLGCLIKRR